MAWNEPGKDGDKDPWGKGNKGDQGPPDLDQVVGNAVKKLNSILGGGAKKRTGSSGSGKGGNGDSPIGAIILIVLAIVVVYGLYTSVYTVNQQERAVVLRLGKFASVEGPGLQFKIPYFDNVQLVNVTQIQSIRSSGTMLTKDENILDVSFSVQWNVSDPQAFVLNVKNPQLSLENASDSAIRHAVGSALMDSVLTEGREVLAAEVQERIQLYLNNYGTGIEVMEVTLESTSAPIQVQEAFDDVIKAKEDQQRLVNQAQAYENQVVQEAEGRAKRVLEEAEGYKAELVNRSEGDSQRFIALLTEYKKAPQVTRERLYLETLSKVYANNSKVLLDVEGGNNMMYIPLDKIMENQGKNVKNASGASQTSGTNVDIKQLTDRVLQEANRRQTNNKRGGR